jgi:hypothetical protein
MSAFSFKASAQWYSITGDNLFRQYLYGVGNHDYYINTEVGGTPYASTAYPMNTSASICGVWDGQIILNTSAGTANNSLYIRPESANDYADYIDGVTSADQLAIQDHILSITPFTDGFQKISADANNTGSITASDLTEIQKLILGINQSLARNSWEWFDVDYISGFPTGFFNGPWGYTLQATYPSVNGFGEWFVTNKTRTWIQANTPEFAAAKIGDVVSPGSGSDHNSWVCAGVAYFNSGNSESRNSTYVENNTKIDKGDLIETNLYLGGGDDIAALEIPIYIDQKKITIESIEMLNGFKPDYHYNKKNNRLTILYLYDGTSTLGIKDMNILSLKLRVKENIDDLSDYFAWDTSRNIELLNKEIKFTDAFVELRVGRVVKSELKINTFVSNENTIVNVVSDKDLNKANIIISNMQGKIIYQKEVNIISGNNEIEFTHLAQSGMYISTLISGERVVSEKFMVSY